MDKSTTCDKCGCETYLEMIYEGRFCSFPSPIQLCNLCKAEMYLKSDDYEPPPALVSREDIPF